MAKLSLKIHDTENRFLFLRPDGYAALRAARGEILLEQQDMGHIYRFGIFKGIVPDLCFGYNFMEKGVTVGELWADVVSSRNEDIRTAARAILKEL